MPRLESGQVDFKLIGIEADRHVEFEPRRHLYTNGWLLAWHERHDAGRGVGNEIRGFGLGNAVECHEDGAGDGLVYGAGVRRE